MKTGSRRISRAGLRSAAAVTALALTLPLAPTAGAQAIPELPTRDTIPGSPERLSLHSPLILRFPPVLQLLIDFIQGLINSRFLKFFVCFHQLILHI